MSCKFEFIVKLIKKNYKTETPTNSKFKQYKFLSLISYNSLSVIRIGKKDEPEKHFGFSVHRNI